MRCRLRLIACSCLIPFTVHLDAQQSIWTFVRPMSIPRSGYGQTLLPNGRVLVTGGLCPGNCPGAQNTELYDPQTGQWSAGAELRLPRYGHVAIRLSDGNVLVAAGS